MESTLRLGTRGSALARWQAEWVAAELQRTGVKVELITITTQGDVRSGPIENFGGQGVFTKEIQRALLEGEVDLAVHSLKDLPTERVPGLTLGAVPPRESPWDALISREGTWSQLPPKARIGTGSQRRRSQLLYARSDLQMLDIRGNVDTRLAKLESGEFDAIVLAEAGLRRLELADRITETFDAAVMLPAVGQGALGIEIREEDATTASCLAPLNDPATAASVSAERSLLASLRGGCLAPIGAWGRVEADGLILEAVVLSPDGAQRLAAQAAGDSKDAEAVGQAVAEQLQAQGAAELIAAARPN